jgi:6-phosphofructokinase 2
MTILAVALNPTIDISSEVQHVQPTHKMRTSLQERHAGGGGVNVARVIAKLGDRPELLIVSGGATGALLEEILAQLPITLRTVHVSGSTRIAFMVFERDTGQEYRFVPEGADITADELEKAMAAVAGFRGDYIVASGSLPRGAPDDTYAKMSDIAAANGVRFVLDTSGAPLRATLEKGQVFLVKPSLGELETLAGRKLDEAGLREEAMRLVREGRSQYVAVTLGREGAILAGANGILRVPAIHVSVKSAVGAGDSFVAALVWMLSNGGTMEEAFRFGVAAGAAAAMTPGTELCHRDDIFAIYEGRAAYDTGA